MTPRERVLMALHHEQPDYPPYNIPIDPEPAGRLDEYFGGPHWRQAIVHHLVAIGTSAGIDPHEGEPLPDGRWRDRFGTIWARGAEIYVDEPVLKKPSLAGYQPPQVFTDEHIQAVRHFCRQWPDRFRGYHISYSFFERAWSLRGMENLLVDMVENPSFVHELFDMLLDVWLPLIDAVGSIPEIDYIQLGDDFGMQRGLIMGVPYWRKFIRPRVKVAYERIKSHGKFVAIHSCGDISPIIEDLIELGVDIINPFQPEAQDIYELKRRYGRHVTFWGGIGTQWLLPRATPDEIRAEIRRIKSEIGRGGGLILEPSKPIMHDVPTENAVACIEAILEGTDTSLPEPKATAA